MTHAENELAYHLNRYPKRQNKTGPRLHTPAHAGPVNDDFKRTVAFQYLQLLPMSAVFLAMVALVWIIAVGL